MAKYYIKKHYRTEGDYPGPEGIHFTRRAVGAAEKFASCEGFLLYEAGQKNGKGPVGAKCVYGYGYVTAGLLAAEEPRFVDGKEYPLVVAVAVVKRLADRTRGIPLWLLREEFGIQMRPTLGGILPIEDDVFMSLKERLDYLDEAEA